jgi:hypothetical protein
MPGPLKAKVYAQNGRDLMECPFNPGKGGGSHLYVNSVNVLNTLAKVLAEDKGRTARDGPKEVRAQSCEPTNRNGIQGPVSWSLVWSGVSPH